MEWRVAWKGKRHKGYGTWSEDKKLVKAWVKEMNRKYPDYHHWCEEKKKENNGTT